MSIVIGEIEWCRPRISDGRFLVPSSFKMPGGRAAACLNHWRDNDRRLRHAAEWGAISNGLMIVHLLDDEDEYERAIVERVRQGQLLFSHGLTTSPEATRAAIKAHDSRAATRPPVYQELPLVDEAIGHVSYVPVANFKQKPLCIIDDEIGRLSQDVSNIVRGWI